MWSGYLDRRGYILRWGIATALVLAFPYLFQLGWLQLRNSVGYDARGAAQLVLFVLMKSGITVIFAIYMLGVVGRRLRCLGSNPWFALLFSGIYAFDALKFSTLGFQAYLMPSFLAPQWSLVAMGMMATLAIVRDSRSRQAEAAPAERPPRPQLAFGERG